MSIATILCVDNNVDYTDALAALLEGSGYRAVTAHSAEEALLRLAETEIDLMILDLRLANDEIEGDVSGLDLAEKIFLPIPKILLTGFPTTSAVFHGLRKVEGSRPALVDLISKDEGPQAILASVEKHLGLLLSNHQLEKVQSFFEQQLLPLGLGGEQIEQQSTEDLEQSRDQIETALRFPEAFGTVKLKMLNDGSLVVAAGSDFHYEFGILPILLERKKLVADRMRETKGIVLTQPIPHPPAGGDTPVKILFLSANPKGTAQLRLDEEVRAIDQALMQTEFRDRFIIRQHWALRAFDLQSYLLRHKPDIVHFSGHGSPASEIILEDNSGKSQPLSPRALRQLFAVLKDNIRCVVLNACFSEQQAQGIAEHIDCVIGMSRAISDPAAAGFAAAFYQALGYGRDVKTAFDLGCIQIDAEGLGEANTPKLLAYRTNPKKLSFV
jgi:CheY-like chemotaxis protein